MPTSAGRMTCRPTRRSRTPIRISSTTSPGRRPALATNHRRPTPHRVRCKYAASYLSAAYLLCPEFCFIKKGPLRCGPSTGAGPRVLESLSVSLDSPWVGTLACASFPDVCATCRIGCCGNSRGTLGSEGTSET